VARARVGRDVVKERAMRPRPLVPEPEASHRVTGENRPGIVGIPVADVVSRGPGAFGAHTADCGRPEDAAWSGARPDPEHLRRAIDDRMADVVAQVMSGRSRVVFLVGASCAGKRRACWEAVHALQGPWRVWEPRSPDDLHHVVDQGGGLSRHPSPRTVIWLDRLDRYLPPGDGDTGQRSVSAITALMHDERCRPVLVLGVAWPGAVGLPPSPAAPAPSAVAAGGTGAAALLQESGLVVPRGLTRAERKRARALARSDERWRQALATAAAAPLAFLAGATQRLERYEHGDPDVRAVVQAAADARRMGAPPELPLSFLLRAATGYLRSHETPLTTVATSLGIATGLLTVTSTDPTGCPADVALARDLEYHLRRSRATEQPPDSLWSAASDVFSDRVVLATLGHSAELRARYGVAARLYERAGNAGDLQAWIRLAQMRERTGDPAGADAAARRAADAGSPAAWSVLAVHRLRSSEPEAARSAFSAAAAAGSGAAWVALVREQELAGRPSAAERLAARAATAGHPGAWLTLGSLRERADDVRGARRAFRAAAAGGSADAWAALCRLEERVGGHTRAEAAAAQAFRQGRRTMWSELVSLRDQRGDRLRAERAAATGAATGDPDGWLALGLRDRRDGHPRSAERAFERAGRAGAGDGWTELARLREASGDPAGAEAAAAAATTGDAWAELCLLRGAAGDEAAAALAFRRSGLSDAVTTWRALARRRERAEDWPAAAEALRRAGILGDGTAWAALATRRESRGDPLAADDAAQRAAACGEPDGWSALALLRERAGDRGGAESAADRAAVAGRVRAWQQLAWRRERAGDVSGARLAHARAAERGVAEARAGTARLLLDQGDRVGAEREFRAAAAEGSTTAWAALAVLRERAGDRAGADEAAEEAAVLGADTWAVLADVRHRAGDLVAAREAAVRAAGLADVRPLRRLAHQCEQAGDWREAVTLARLAVAAGCADMCAVLARARQRCGDHEGADRIRRFGVDARGDPARPDRPDLERWQ
jgi:hypothetical protein